MKKLGKALLFPHIAVMTALIPLSALLFAYTASAFGTDSVFTAVSYAVMAYTLSVWCIRAPSLVRAFRGFERENAYVRRWREDARLRISVSLLSSSVWNAAYAVFQLWLGYKDGTFWFYSLAVYYALLFAMRFLLLRHTAAYTPGESPLSELKKYRACGIALLVINAALAVIIFFMVGGSLTFRHGEIVTIAIAAYTFTSLASAIVGAVRYRRYESPVYSASKAISLVSASVSMLTLTSSMLSAFGDGEGAFDRTALLLAGAGVTAFILGTAVCMIYNGTKRIYIFKIEGNGNNNGKR